MRLSKKLGFRVTPCAIRHTFATDAIIRGVDLQTIAGLMGNVDWKTLSRIYQHSRKHSDQMKECLRKAIGIGQVAERPWSLAHLWPLSWLADG